MTGVCAETLTKKQKGKNAQSQKRMDAIFLIFKALRGKKTTPPTRQKRW